MYSTHRYAVSFPPKREIVIRQLLRGVLVTLFRELSLYNVDRTAAGNNKRKKPRRQRQQTTQSTKYFATVENILISGNRRLSGKFDEELSDKTVGFDGF